MSTNANSPRPDSAMPNVPSAERIERMIRDEMASDQPSQRASAFVPKRSAPPTSGATAQARPDRTGVRLSELTAPDGEAFVEHASSTLLGRPPTASETWERTSELLRGDAKVAILGRMRFSPEGRRHGTRVEGLWARHIFHSMLRLPAIGAALEWIAGVVRLPRSFRYFRHAEQRNAMEIARLRATNSTLASDLDAFRAEHSAALQLAQESSEKLAQAQADLLATDSRRIEEIHALRQASADLARELAESRSTVSAIRGQELGEIRRQLAEQQVATKRASLLDRELALLRSASDRILPTDLPAVLEVQAQPLVEPTKQPISSAQAHTSGNERYSAFEHVFYQSAVVAEKQRIYLQYVDRTLAADHAFLDLGCGRGEFMTLLREIGVHSRGIDVSAKVIDRLQHAGHDAIHADLVEFLERDTGLYSGAVALQVVEHLDAAGFERFMELIGPRLLPGAPLIIESVNPHSPFALGNFHMDPTHVAPVPPERVRFYMEYYGFARTLTLFQAPIPSFAFGGPDRRAHYCDYAVLGYRT